ncbi:type IV pilus biogenesis/stability protein PilW [Rhodoferax sediminis]|uniref:Type IV pilus biogenesis/stability protein PilW n=1 Tax=Rhodoferax sediminis TaxID=2509614 RepID=A0A515DBP9_9BURK|nr:type IV pilus biogenesis/stability protein PilW [Rhodoferax sediminis]QDL37809.1 type IV pilus biogenesis/stability protein PilW [Rhodoferax sediminis]
MKNPGVGKRQVVLWLAQACFVVSALAGLAGCAANSGTTGASDAGTDIATESDATPARKRAQIRLDLAVDYFNRGQTTIALDELKRAIVTDPSYGEAYNLRGLVYMRLDDPKLAEDSFRRAMALKPRDGGILHNYGWMLCQQRRYPEADQAFKQALAIPLYGEKAKTLMTEGLCQMQAGHKAEAEATLSQSYQLDAGNPITGYNLASLLFQRNELTRARFYIRRINNTDLANAESLWLGIKVERRMNNREAMLQLADQLQRRFPQSPELVAYQKGAFDE